MATQHLLHGGYTGKLGDTIGERWKGIYYVKAYAKPSQPNTPAQLSARAHFKAAIKCMQAGMAITGRQGYLDTTHRNEAQSRTSHALQAIKSGKGVLDSVFWTPATGAYNPAGEIIRLLSPDASAWDVYWMRTASGAKPKQYLVSIWGGASPADFSRIVPASWTTPNYSVHTNYSYLGSIPAQPGAAYSDTVGYIIFDGVPSAGSLPASYSRVISVPAVHGWSRLAAFDMAHWLIGFDTNWTAFIRWRDFIYNRMRSNAGLSKEIRHSQTIYSTASSGYPIIACTGRWDATLQHLNITATLSPSHPALEFHTLASIITTDYTTHRYCAYGDANPDSIAANARTYRYEIAVAEDSIGAPLGAWITFVTPSDSGTPLVAANSKTFRVL